MHEQSDFGGSKYCAWRGISVTSPVMLSGASSINHDIERRV